MSTYNISMPDDLGKKYEQFRYPGGEIQVRLLPGELSEISRAQKLVVKARLRDGEIMALALLTDALRHAGDFREADLQLDYLPYGRADRRFVPGDSFALKVFGRMLGDLGYDRIITIDVHSHMALAVINNLINVQPDWLIRQAIKQIGRKELSILLPDKGAARYQLKGLRLPILRADKMRDVKTGRLTGFTVPIIKTKRILIVDDICDGGGTFLGIADEILDKQPETELYLYVTHGLFSKGLAELEKRFRQVFTSDSLFREDKNV